MNCKKCGAANAENAKFCGGCGAELVEKQTNIFCGQCGASNLNGAAFCVSCGAGLRQAPASEPVMTQMTQMQAPVYTQPAEETPKKAKKGFGKFAVIALVLVIVLGGGAVLASTVFKSDISRLMMGEEKYAKSIIKDIVIDVTDAALDMCDDAQKQLSVGNSGTGGAFEFKYTAKLASKEYEKYADLMFLYGDEAELMRLLLNSTVDVSAKFDLNADNPQIELTIEWLVDNTKVLTINCSVVDDVLYVGIPELYGKSLSLNLKDYNMSFTDAVGQLMGAAAGTDSTQYVLDVIKTISDNKSTLKSMVNDVVDAALSKIDTIELIQNVKVSVNGKEAGFDEVAVKLNQEQAGKAAVAALECIADNQKYVDVITALANEFDKIGYASYYAYYGYEDEDAYTSEDIKDEIQYSIDEIKDSVSGDGSELLLSLYLNSSNKVVGYNIEAGETKSTMIFSPGTGYELTVIDSYYGETTRIYGDLTKDLSGNLDITVKNDYEDYTLRVLEFSKLKFNLTKNELNGSVKLNLGRLLTDMYDNDVIYDSEIVDLLKDASLTLSIDSGAKKAKASIQLTDGDSSIILDVGSEAGSKVNVKAPASNVESVGVLSDFGTMLGEVDTNLQGLIDKIVGLGYDIGWLKDALGEVMSNIY